MISRDQSVVFGFIGIGWLAVDQFRHILSLSAWIAQIVAEQKNLKDFAHGGE
jgi:hypothetical protein